MYCNYLQHYKRIKPYIHGMPGRCACGSAGTVCRVVITIPAAAIIITAAEVAVAMLLPPLSQLLSPCCHHCCCAIVSCHSPCCCRTIESPLLACHGVVVAVPLHRRCS